jgi:hypothetical protein
MESYPIGYARLAAGLDIVPLLQIARIDSRTRNRSTHMEGSTEVLTFKAEFAPESTLAGDLQFAFQYLQVLDALFVRCGAAPLEEWLTESPTSAYARRAGFLFEWLTQRSLNVSPVNTKKNWIPVLDEKLQFGLGRTKDHNHKFRVRNNLPGTPDFCPLVRKNAAIREFLRRDLKSRNSPTSWASSARGRLSRMRSIGRLSRSIYSSTWLGRAVARCRRPNTIVTSRG